MSSSNPFEHFKRLAKSKSKPESLEGWNSFVADTYFANFPDTVLLADISSRLGNIPEDMRELFYRGTVEKGQRRHFWPKQEKEEKIKDIMKMFDMSFEKARELAMFLPTSKIVELKERGKVKK